MAAGTYKSARVVLQLIVEGTTYSVSHVGNNFLITRSDCHIPPGTNAELRITVDDDIRTTPIFLPHGISGPGTRVDWFEIASSPG